MRRRDFMKSGVLGAAAAYVPPHNFDKYDFGSGPVVENRLNQGPFPADLYPSWTVVMALTPSEEIVPNYGMGLVTYLCDEVDCCGRAARARRRRSKSSSSFHWALTFIYE